ncbi:MAG TPA: hypothetical protein VF529_17415 [Solirubrobacteraceae bacterium]|jgi:uncharacterized delta-60 repeat protein
MSRITLLLLAALLALALPAAASAAPGDLDTTFGAPHGFTVPPIGTLATDVLVQPDGKIAVALDSFAYPQRMRMARFDPDGTLDETFNPAGAIPGVAELDVSDTPESVTALTRQADGKYVIAGSADGGFAVVRFRADGTPDPGWNDLDPETPPGSVVTDTSGIGPSGTLEDVAVAPGNCIVVVGRVSTGATSTALVAVRYVSIGLVDIPGFNDADAATPKGMSRVDTAGVDAQPSGVVVDPDGSVVISGLAGAPGSERVLAARLTPAGTTDAGFGEGGRRIMSLGSPALPDGGNGLIRLPEGGYAMAAVVDLSGTASADSALIRLTDTGKPDAGFGGGDGVALADFTPLEVPTSVARQADGKLVLAGGAGDELSSIGVMLARFHPDGTVDRGYGAGGAAVRRLAPGASYALGLGLDGSDRAVVAGSVGVTVPTPIVARFAGGEPAAAPPPSSPAADAVVPTPPATTPPPVQPAGRDEPPVLGRVTLSRSRFRVGRGMTALAALVRAGTTFRFTLSEAATVEVAIARATPGRRRAGRCVKPSGRLARHPRCTRLVRAGSLRRRLAAGTARIAFTGRLGRRPLKPGRYVATLTATDAAGQRSAPRKAAFRVLPTRPGT